MQLSYFNLVKRKLICKDSNWRFESLAKRGIFFPQLSASQKETKRKGE